MNPAYRAYETQLLTGASRNKHLVPRGHSKAQPRDYRSRALPLELSRRHGVSGDLTISCSQSERIASNAYPAKPGVGAGVKPRSILAWFIVIKDVSCPNWTTPAMWSWRSYSKTQPPHYECGALPLELTSTYGAGDRTRTGVWTLARSHLSHWKTPASWSGVRESNSSGWFGRPVPKALGQPRLKPSN